MFGGNRVTLFAITFLFALPAMVLLFRGDDGLTSQDWTLSATFAAIIATGSAAFFGRTSE